MELFNILSPEVMLRIFTIFFAIVSGLLGFNYINKIKNGNDIHPISYLFIPIITMSFLLIFISSAIDKLTNEVNENQHVKVKYLLNGHTIIQTVSQKEALCLKENHLVRYSEGEEINTVEVRNIQINWEGIEIPLSSDSIQCTTPLNVTPPAETHK